MIPGEDIDDQGLDRAPRTCGDDPKNTARQVLQLKCSPHMRG